MNNGLINNTLELSKILLPTTKNRKGLAEGHDATILSFISKVPQKLLTEEIFSEAQIRIWKYETELSRTKAELSIELFNKISKTNDSTKTNRKKIISTTLKSLNNFNQDDARLGAIYIENNLIKIILSRQTANGAYLSILKKHISSEAMFGKCISWELELDHYNLVQFVLPEMTEKFRLLGLTEYQQFIEEEYATIETRRITEIFNRNHVPRSILIDSDGVNFDIILGNAVSKLGTKFLRPIADTEKEGKFSVSTSFGQIIQNLIQAESESVFCTRNAKETLEFLIEDSIDETPKLISLGCIPLPIYCVAEKMLTYIKFTITHYPRDKQVVHLVNELFEKSKFTDNTNTISVKSEQDLINMQIICGKLKIPTYMIIGKTFINTNIITPSSNDGSIKGDEVFQHSKSYLKAVTNNPKAKLTYIGGRFFEITYFTSGRTIKFHAIKPEETKQLKDFIGDNRPIVNEDTERHVLNLKNLGAYNLELTGTRIYRITPILGANPLDLSFVAPQFLKNDGESVIVTVQLASTGQKLIELLSSEGIISKEHREKHLPTLINLVKSFEANYSQSKTDTGNLKIQNFKGEKQIDPSQRGCVEIATRLKKCLIADEPGFGKTWESLGTICHNNAWPLLVITPRIGKLSWSAEAERLTQNKSQVILGTKAPSERAEERKQIGNSDIVIINYNMLSEFKEALKNNKFKAIIIDESHYIKHADSLRSQHTQEIVNSVKPDFLLPMSGSHWENRPFEAWTTIKMLNKEYLFGGESGFKKRYCFNNKKTGYKYDGASNLEEFNEILRTHFMIRREKTGTGKRTWRQSYFPTSELDLREYKLAEDDLSKYIYEQLKGEAEQMVLSKNNLKSMTPKLKDELAETLTELVKAKGSKSMSSAEALAKIAICRKLIGNAKVEFSIEWIENFIEQENKLVVFAHHVTVQQKLIEHFEKSNTDIVKITAQMSDVKRKESAESFLNGSAKVIFCSIGAASENINLAAASHVLFIEGTGKPLTQARKRIDRHPQKSKILNAWYLRAEGTIDDWIYDMADKKASDFAVGSGDSGDELLSKDLSEKYVMKMLSNFND